MATNHDSISSTYDFAIHRNHRYFHTPLYNCRWIHNCFILSIDFVQQYFRMMVVIRSTAGVVFFNALIKKHAVPDSYYIRNLFTVLIIACQHNLFTVYCFNNSMSSFFCDHMYLMHLKMLFWGTVHRCHHCWRPVAHKHIHSLGVGVGVGGEGRAESRGVAFLGMSHQLTQVSFKVSLKKNGYFFFLP